MSRDPREGDAGSRSLDVLLPRADQERVVAAVAAAERSTSGEVRVHIDAHLPAAANGDALAWTRALLPRLGIARTRRRNGVLIYVAVTDRRFAIWGDEGIHGAVGEAFWAEAAARMRDGFRTGRIGDGIVAGVAAVADVLARHFPRSADDEDELPDAISHGPVGGGGEPGVC